MTVGSLEEVIDDNHAIVSSSVGTEYYVHLHTFVDQDVLEPGCLVLLHNKVIRSALVRVDVAYKSVAVFPCLGFKYCWRSSR